jgi:hypothetical protein
LALELDAALLFSGDTLNGSVSYKNVGNAPVTVRRILLSARRPGAPRSGRPVDTFTPSIDHPTIIQPGESVGLVAGRTFTDTDPDGSWEVLASIQDGDDLWHDTAPQVVAKSSVSMLETASVVVPISGNNQTGVAGTTLPAPCVVAVRDALGRPVPGFPVRFAITSSNPLGAGLLWPAMAYTDAQGLARTTLTLSVIPRPHVVTATAEGLEGIYSGPLEFHANATPWPESVMNLFWLTSNDPSGMTTYTNLGGSPLWVNRLSIQIRPAGGMPSRPDYVLTMSPEIDFPSILGPSEQLQLAAAHYFDLLNPGHPGPWEAFTVVEDAHGAHYGPTRNFTVPYSLAYANGTAAQPLASLAVASTEGTVQPSAITWTQDWDTLLSRGMLERAAARDAAPVVTWQPAAPLADIQAGMCDSYLRACAQIAAASRSPIYIKFATGMNGKRHPWCAHEKGNSPALYIAAWRHVVDVFRENGAGNVRWVWAPDPEYAGSTPLASVYPGDRYVDWLAIEGDVIATRPWESWEAFHAAFRPTHDKIAAVSGKPIMVSGMAAPVAASDPADLFLKNIPVRFKRLRALVWFLPESREQDGTDLKTGVRLVGSASFQQGGLK